MKRIVLIACIAITFFASLQIQAQGTCVSTLAGTPYDVGVKVTYETLANGTDVKVTFQMLDLDKPVLLAYLFNQDPFSETIMDKEDDYTFSLTLIGQTGTITKACKMVLNAGGDIVSPYFPYEVNTDCSGSDDTTPPNNFVAEVGAITAFSVEFLLNATDDSGNVAFYVTYNGVTSGTSSLSGVETSLVIPRLTSETDYNFSVSAADLAGNNAMNNPILLDATTGIDTSTPCEGSGAEAEQGQFQAGYNYTFETLPSGTDVEITFELLDQGRGLGPAYLWRAPPPLGPGFLETPMSLVSGQTFTATVSGLTTGEKIYYSCKFVVEGGALVPKYLEYTVGDACVLGVNDLDLLAFKAYPNPTSNSWKLSTKNINMISIQVVDILGKNVMTLNPNTSDVVIDASTLKAGLYFAQIKTVSGLTSLKLVKK